MQNKRLFIIILAVLVLVLAVGLTFVFLSRPTPAAMSATALAEAVGTAYPQTMTARAAWTSTYTPAPTATVTATAAPTASILLDDFSKFASGWSIDSWDAGSIGYSDGKYLITVIPTDHDVWSYVGKSFTDAEYSTDASVVTPVGDGVFGILCRYQDGDNFYALEVSEEGFFKIWKKVAGENTALYDWEYSEAIPTGVPFTIQAACSGSQLSLSVNDVLLATVEDGSFTKGKYGLIAGTADNGNFGVTFDNFEVKKP